MRVYIITLSDKGYEGNRRDKSGERLKELCSNHGWEIVGYRILPDDKVMIEQTLMKITDDNLADIIFTTGGTGVSPRDVTPEATLAVIEKRLHGIEIAMMVESLKKTPRAIISRAVAGIRKETVIINFPGSVKAVEENFKAIEQAIEHLVEKLQGNDEDCGRR
ncbi:MogA/MoaB family molybdenum cofactor biosynthesis protein [Thermosipho ferrireducens]|uniref:MogA/MoaB family molybdenum cofactor biosynthesis protein n=1 Tax=Thermosipho ferrireducens TaxID=2571116 RepID=A0ABX7S919_9BACT|nr:MogA/MoaB family molybdenum cofactor biosynthesis protein [Thermosipho ferrireducens]QTA38360.1 MogA/MoaB family molybdenum cofactor biosynthesis protein [Thermosipho ferrireducens]